MAKSAFRLALEEAVAQRHSALHPWSEAWASGKLDRRIFGEWVKQQYHFVRHFSEWIAAVYANCPHQEVQQFLLENVAEEEGLIGSGDFSPVRHTELLLEFAEICGTPRAHVLEAEVKGELLPELIGLRSWCTVQSRRPFIEALPGLLIGLESQVPGIYRKTMPPLIDKYGFAEDELTYFSLHIVADVDHGEKGYEIVEKYATTDEQRATAVHLVKEAAAMRRLYLDGLHRKLVGQHQAVSIAAGC
jgi:pyrroloquinoline-quinone synthase